MTTLAVADVETTYLKNGARPQTLFWGLAIEGEDYRAFQTSKRLMDFLSRRTDDLLVYCHHDYDIVQLGVDGFHLKYTDVRGGRILRAYSHDHVEWRNSLALFVSKLADILEACGFEKPPLNAAGHKPGCLCPDCFEMLKKRNRADTTDALKAFRIIAERWERVWGIYPLGERYLTAASTTFAAAQQVAGDLPVWLENRDAYRGGRVEAFQLDFCGEADLYDINSSYPYSFLDAPKKDDLYYLDVHVKTNGPGPLCSVGDDREKLMFPAGKFRTAVWGSNYERYIKPHGGIAQVKGVEKIPCDFQWLRDLSGLVKRAFAERQAAKARNDAPAAYAAKIGLNAIYGRLGLKDERETVYYTDKIPDDPDITWYELSKEKAIVFRKIPSKPTANYLFASFVTDNARARLYHAMQASGETFYCDTDSIYLPRGRKFRAQTGSELGQWKYEGTNPLTVYGLKDYEWGPHVKLKGGKGGLTWTPKAMLDGKNVRYVEKTHSRNYDKRQKLFSGKTLPVEVWDW